MGCTSCRSKKVVKGASVSSTGTLTKEKVFTDPKTGTKYREVKQKRR